MLNYTDTNSKVHEQILDAMNWEVQQMVSSDVFRNDNFRIEMVLDPITKNFVFSLKGIVYGAKTKTEDIIKVPDGKFAMFKLAILPSWLLKKFPPKMKEFAQTITVYNSYPTLPIKESTMRWRTYDFQ